MIKVIYFLFLVGLFASPACITNSSKELENSATEKNKIISASNNEISVNRPTNDELPSEKNDRKAAGKYPVVWISVFELTEFKELTDDFTVWDAKNSEYDRLFPDKKRGGKKNVGVDVDLMNCAGYLASGKVFIKEHPASEAESPDWRLKISPATIAKDAEAKIKQCSVPNAAKKSSDDRIFNQAFAVAPPDARRGNITINQPTDTRKLFASLPDNIKKTANSDNSRKDSQENADDLDLRDDSWSDLDGDGVIDIVFVSGGDAVILILVNGKWKEIVKF